MILTALGVDLEGSREVLVFRASSEESKDGWSALMQELRSRGVNQIDLIVTDGHDGLLAAVANLFPSRCWDMTTLNAFPRSEDGLSVRNLV